MKQLGPSVRKVYVWDRLVRSLHWLLATLVLATFFWLEGGDAAHDWAGYGAVLVVLLRMIWGVVGSHYARFVNFAPTPARLRAYLACYRQHGRCAMLGHNPVGACMVLTMLVTVVMLAVTGWMMGTEAFWGDPWLDQVHTALAYLLIMCASLHVSMVILLSRLSRINLPKAMVIGYKQRGEGAAPFHDWVEVSSPPYQTPVKAGVTLQQQYK